MDTYVQVPCVFLSAVQAATHGELGVKTINPIVERSRQFVDQEKSDGDLWHFFGRDSGIEPDIDDTFYCLAASGGVARATVQSALDGILKISGSEGPLLPTWYRAGANSVDYTVNANALHCLGMLGYRDARVNDLVSALREVLMSGAFLEGSPYYPDPLCFVLSYVRASKYYPELASTAVRKSIGALLDDYLPRVTTQLQLAMALEVSISIDSEPDITDRLAETLLGSLEKSPRCDASLWFRHRSVELYYAAPAATAVFAFSALHLYLEQLTGGNELHEETIHSKRSA